MSSVQKVAVVVRYSKYGVTVAQYRRISGRFVAIEGMLGVEESSGEHKVSDGFCAQRLFDILVPAISNAAKRAVIVRDKQRRVKMLSTLKRTSDHGVGADDL